MQKSGKYMEAEIREAPGVFSQAVRTNVQIPHGTFRSFYTVARGSSDAVANILAYEFMAELGCPMTSLPPSVFSIGAGVDLADAVVLVISQSGASDDLVLAAKGARARGASVVAVTNVPGSDVEAAAHMIVPVGAGPEIAVPATKTVVGSIAAGMSLLAGLKPTYAQSCANAGQIFDEISAGTTHDKSDEIINALLRSDSVYVIGRGSGFGAAQEVALKLKETCALHAEAYSASEVLHGPLQLVTKPLTVLILDTGEIETQTSIAIAEAKFRELGARVFRISTSSLGGKGLVPAAASALLIYYSYKIILGAAIALGFDPDAPNQLAKITRTV